MGGRGKSELAVVADELRVIRLGDRAPWDGLLEQLRRRAKFRVTLLYTLDEHAESGPLSTRRLASTGPEADGIREALGELLRQRRTAYDPRRVTHRQRNRAHSLGRLAGWGEASPQAVALYKRLTRDATGLRLDQVRMLVCEGATMLGWVGGFAPGQTTEAQAALLTSLAPALRERLRLEETLSRLPLAEATLDGILETADGPAALVDAGGRPVMLNALARERLEASPGVVRRSWREAVLGDATEYRCVCVHAPGLPRHYFLVAREDRGAAEGRLRARSADWRLSAREQQALALVVRGRTNEMMARDLACSVRTAELYVTRLLARAGVGNRASLVARFWSDAVIFPDTGGRSGAHAVRSGK